MKKAIYYIAPFVVFPLLVLLINFLDSIEMQSNIWQALTLVLFFLFAALMGVLSPTEKTFDYLMTLLIPAAFLCTLFVSLYFDEGCDGLPQLSLHHALNMHYYRVWLPYVAIMTGITFITSFMPIRVSSIRKKDTE